MDKNEKKQHRHTFRSMNTQHRMCPLLVLLFYDDRHIASIRFLHNTSGFSKCTADPFSGNETALRSPSIVHTQYANVVFSVIKPIHLNHIDCVRRTLHMYVFVAVYRPFKFHWFSLFSWRDIALETSFCFNLQRFNNKFLQLKTAFTQQTWKTISICISHPYFSLDSRLRFNIFLDDLHQLRRL